MRRRRRWLTCLPRSSRFTRPLTFPGLGRRTVRTERPPPFGRFRCLHAPFRMFAGGKTGEKGASKNSVIEPAAA